MTPSSAPARPRAGGAPRRARAIKFHFCRRSSRCVDGSIAGAVQIGAELGDFGFINLRNPANVICRSAGNSKLLLEERNHVPARDRVSLRLARESNYAFSTLPIERDRHIRFRSRGRRSLSRTCCGLPATGEHQGSNRRSKYRAQINHDENRRCEGGILCEGRSILQRWRSGVANIALVDDEQPGADSTRRAVRLRMVRNLITDSGCEDEGPTVGQQGFQLPVQAQENVPLFTPMIRNISRRVFHHANAQRAKLSRPPCCGPAVAGMAARLDLGPIG